MMKYLVILLSEQSTSFCYYNSNDSNGENKLIPLKTLRNAIKYAFLEDLFIQFVLPPFPLPKEYEDIITSTKASIIAPTSTSYKADVMVIDGVSMLNNTEILKDVSYVLRTNKNDFFKQYKEITRRIVEFSRLNIVLTDIENFKDADYNLYKQILEEFACCVKNITLSGKNIQLNVLTDRLVEKGMNNCNAGNKTITLAPDGQFYICPAFYYAKEQSVGDLGNGLKIRNSQLYKLEYAPLCRECDAYQCKRCVYLNKRLTREVNTPSKEQCVVSHIERNASRFLLLAIREHIIYMPKTEIKEISYLDPFDNIQNK